MLGKYSLAALPPDKNSRNNQMWSNPKTLLLIRAPQAASHKKPELKTFRSSSADGQQIYFLVPEASLALRALGQPSPSKKLRLKAEKSPWGGWSGSPRPGAGRGEITEANPQCLRRQAAVFPPLFFKARNSLSLSALPLQRGRLYM